MGRRKKALILLSILLLAALPIILSSVLNSNIVAETSGNPDGGTSVLPETSSESKPPGEVFVVPESPLGPIGVVGALVVAFGVFKLKKKE